MEEMLTGEKTKELAAGYIEMVWNNMDFSALTNLTTPAYIYILGGQAPRNRADMKKFLQDVHTAFPDWRVRIEDMIAEDKSVAVRWSGKVTHKGIFHGISPTGKNISVCGINIFTMEGNRISQEREQMDSLGMLRQLGVLPPAQHAP